MNISKSGWWMIGGASIAVIGVGVFIRLSRKHTKAQLQATSTATPIGAVLQVTTNPMGTTKQEPNWNSPFNMQYLIDVQQWVAPKKIQLLEDSTAKRLAKIIKEAKGIFNDDEAAIKDVFGKKLRDKTQVASLSKAFYALYQQDMWQYLNSFLSTQEIAQYVSKYITRLPNYQL